jgi:hypothetical protein
MHQKWPFNSSATYLNSKLLSNIKQVTQNNLDLYFIVANYNVSRLTRNPNRSLEKD